MEKTDLFRTLRCLFGVEYGADCLADVFALSLDFVGKSFTMIAVCPSFDTPAIYVCQKSLITGICVFNADSALLSVPTVSFAVKRTMSIPSVSKGAKKSASGVTIVLPLVPSAR
jgi:hypothetical protein